MVLKCTPHLTFVECFDVISMCYECKPDSLLSFPSFKFSLRGSPAISSLFLPRKLQERKRELKQKQFQSLWEKIFPIKQAVLDIDSYSPARVMHSSLLTIICHYTYALDSCCWLSPRAALLISFRWSLHLNSNSILEKVIMWKRE